MSSARARGHMYRTILECIAFEELFAMNAVEKSTGVVVREMVVMGGGAENEFWRQLIADIFVKKLCLIECSESSALGAGIAAAVGAVSVCHIDLLYTLLHEHFYLRPLKRIDGAACNRLLICA